MTETETEQKKYTKQELVVLLGTYTTARDHANTIKEKFGRELIKYNNLDMVLSEIPRGMAYNLPLVRCYGKSTIDLLSKQLLLEVECGVK